MHICLVYFKTTDLYTCDDTTTSSKCRNWLRMDEKTFMNLLDLIGDKLKKADTVMREAITPAQRLAVTLRYMATGNSFRELSYWFRLGERTIAYIVLETCQVICDTLNYLFTLPSTPAEWEEVAKDFFELWNFPRLLGEIDGKHLVLK